MEFPFRKRSWQLVDDFTTNLGKACLLFDVVAHHHIMKADLEEDEEVEVSSICTVCNGVIFF